MADQYARVIIDISHEKVDRPFTYRIPDSLSGMVKAGSRVRIPFGSGNRERTGYVVELSSQAGYDRDKIKELTGLVEGSVTAESQLIELAWWMKERYGSTMNQALKTVLPVKQQVKGREKKYLRCLLDSESLSAAYEEAVRKKYRARARLLEAFVSTSVIPWETAVSQLNVTQAAVKPLIEKGIVVVESQHQYRNPAETIGRKGESGERAHVNLNPQQKAIADDFCRRYDSGIRETALIHGITGSGKTEVYMEIISHIQENGKESIVLIPEISLTYQTVMRFYRRFGNQVSFINSKMSAGERYDQFERARKGEISIMVGPRSALFTPFLNLGLIVIDEEHESAYKSELSPRYHARETAAFRAKQSGAGLILGSATPSVESYKKAKEGIYRLYTLSERAKKDSRLANAEIVDLRRELAEGNKSIFSRLLQEKIEDRLEKGQQIMLFMNRRGYSNFISCRSCGEAIKCPHCDVTLTLHKDGRLVCHYCGYSTERPKICPSCGSPYLAGFGAGTQKIEAMVQERFPGVKTLRMDMDTTSRKGGHEEILAAFAAGEAQILVGTQMIVKGHDFPNVTLVGILAADISLYAPDFSSGERTFQLLTQAAGRAGRGKTAGDVIIQTYAPDHYSIQAAARQDYQMFFKREMAYRRLLHYPPTWGMVTVQMTCPDEQALAELSGRLEERLKSGLSKLPEVELIGPVNAPIYKLHDLYRKILYLKSENYDILIKIRKWMEDFFDSGESRKDLTVQYDFL